MDKQNENKESIIIKFILNLFKTIGDGIDAVFSLGKTTSGGEEESKN